MIRLKASFRFSTPTLIFLHGGFLAPFEAIDLADYIGLVIFLNSFNDYDGKN